MLSSSWHQRIETTSEPPLARGHFGAITKSGREWGRAGESPVALEPSRQRRMLGVRRSLVERGDVAIALQLGPEQHLDAFPPPLCPQVGLQQRQKESSFEIASHGGGHGHQSASSILSRLTEYNPSSFSTLSLVLLNTLPHLSLHSLSSCSTRGRHLPIRSSSALTTLSQKAFSPPHPPAAPPSSRPHTLPGNATRRGCTAFRGRIPQAQRCRGPARRRRRAG